MRRKIIGSFLATIFLTILLFFLAFVFGARYELYHAVQEKVIAQANAVSMGNTFSPDTLLNHTVADYSNAIMQSYQQKGVELSIYNRSGKMIQSSTGMRDDKIDALVKDVQKNQNMSRMYIQKQAHKHQMYVYWKLTYKGQLIAILKFKISLQKADAMFELLIKKALLVCSIVFVIAILFASVLAEKIVRPFEEIIVFIKEMSKGDYKKKLLRKEKDEAGKIADTLNFLGDEIQRKNRERYDFISSISHELKTPLTAIYGWTETLQEQCDLTKEEQQLGLVTIRQETQRLTQMVDNLLYFAKNEAERSKLYMEDVAVKAYMEDILSLMKIRTAQKQIQLEYNTTVTNMYVDAGKMKQVFLNLIENAIKFSPEKTSIKILISKEGSEVKIDIIDQGIGIAKEELQKITNEFYQVHANAQGEGLGLAVCSNIIALHKGRFWIESALNEGTSVHILLPQTDN